MHIGLIGLGKMGGNMRERLRRGGHTVVGYDRNADISDVSSLEELVDKLESPKVVWVMVPSGDPTRETVKQLGELLGEGDVVVDGGNSRWTDDTDHAKILHAKGVGYVDCGVSGGVWGLDNGYALMCGGDADDVAKVQPAFDTLKPEGDFGFVHAGPVGAGHFSKMVHNGIEYGVMAAYAEGLGVLRDANVGLQQHAIDAETTPLRDPELAKIAGYAEDSGEGRWTIEAAIDHAVPMHVITASLFARFQSRQDESPAMKAVAAMRNQFGGHAVRAGGGEGETPSGDVSAP